MEFASPQMLFSDSFTNLATSGLGFCGTSLGHCCPRSVGFAQNLLLYRTRKILTHALQGAEYKFLGSLPVFQPLRSLSYGLCSIRNWCLYLGLRKIGRISFRVLLMITITNFRCLMIVNRSPS